MNNWNRRIGCNLMILDMSGLTRADEISARRKQMISCVILLLLFPLPPPHYVIWSHVLPCITIVQFLLLLNKFGSYLAITTNNTFNIKRGQEQAKHHRPILEICIEKKKTNKKKMDRLLNSAHSSGIIRLRISPWSFGLIGKHEQCLIHRHWSAHKLTGSDLNIGGAFQTIKVESVFSDIYREVNGMFKWYLWWL